MMPDNKDLKNAVKVLSASVGLKEKSNPVLKTAEEQNYLSRQQSGNVSMQDSSVQQEVQASQTNVNVKFKIDEKTLKLGAKTVFAAGGAAVGMSVLGPVVTGLGFAIGGPALGVMGWTVGHVAGIAGGGILGKKFSDKVVGDTAEEEKGVNGEKGIYADISHQSNKWKRG